MKTFNRIQFDFGRQQSYEAGFDAGRSMLWREAQRWLEERDRENGRLVRLWFALGIAVGFLLAWAGW